MEIPELLPPLPAIPSANETLGEPPPSPPSPEVQAPPPESTESPPPPTVVQPPPSPPTPPVPNPKLEPPPSSEEPNEPPPSQSPPAPPQEVTPSLSPPPPKQAVPPPSPESNSSPTLSPPQPSSPSPPSGKPDPQPHSPPTNPSGRLAPPPSKSSSPVIPSSPPPTSLDSSPIIPSPPIPGPPTPPAETIDSPVPGTPAPSLPTPTSPESSSPVTDPLLTPVGSENPSPSTPPKERPTNNTQSLTPPRQSGSASDTPASKESFISSSNFRHAAIGMAVVGVFVGLFAICFLVARKKRKRSEGLAVHYKPPSSYSVKSDGYYYRQANMTNSTQFETESAYKPSPFPSSTGMFGSQVDCQSYSGTPESVMLGNSKSYFTLEEIAEITQGFARQNLLGEGGFGCVYKGWLTDGRVVAVKQLKAGSGQGEREFRAEVEIISRVHHRHLVSLVGYCISEQHRSLVYEFVPNKTLEHHLHGKGLPVMDWPKRVKIAIGSGRGLAYLHEDCHPRIIHRDIKSANILLDDSFEAQVADFGLAKLSNDINTHVSTRVMGTFGYMAPEYASSGKLTDRSDVFSFGVVLLELITGRKPVDPSQPLGEESLVEWARPRLNHALESWNFEEVVDPRLENNYVKSEMFKMMEAAAACVRHSGPKRPRMAQVLRALDYDGHLPDLSNGVKFGQSTAFDSRQYSSDIQQFRRMAFGSCSYSSDRTYTEEFDNSTTQSGEYGFTETASWPLNAGRQNSGDYQSSREYAPRSKSRRDSDCSSGSCRYNGRGLH